MDGLRPQFDLGPARFLREGLRGAYAKVRTEKHFGKLGTFILTQQRCLAAVARRGLAAEPRLLPILRQPKATMNQHHQSWPGEAGESCSMFPMNIAIGGLCPIFLYF